jgi:hypothetical protein
MKLLTKNDIRLFEAEIGEGKYVEKCVNECETMG